MIARAAQAHDHRQDRRHACGRGHCLLGTFQCRNALFKGAHRGVGVTRIDIAGCLAREPRGRIGCGAEHVAGGQEHGVAVLALRCTVLTRTYGQGVERYAFKVAVQPTGIPILTHAAHSLL